MSFGFTVGFGMTFVVVPIGFTVVFSIVVSFIGFVSVVFSIGFGMAMSSPLLSSPSAALVFWNFIRDAGDMKSTLFKNARLALICVIAAARNMLERKSTTG